MRIVVDAMGGDFAPRAAVEGAVQAARAYRSTIVLVGRAPEIEAQLARQQAGGLDLEIVHAADVIAMDELAPAEAIRTTPQNSISRGVALVRDGEADAFVTAGHTGATLAGATFGLGRLPGVRRPALATPFPTLGGPCVLIDIGANAEVKPEYLLQFGVMGAAYAERVLDIRRPRVGLVSIGEERGKGNLAVREASSLLEASNLNFIGNIEGREIPSGNVDVAVMDGFTGNVMIKFAEGLAGLVERMLREAATGDPLGMLGGLLLRPSLRRARRRMDYRAYGGAVLLGVRSVVVIGHGRSDSEAIKTAIGVAVRAVENDLIGAIATGVASSTASTAGVPVVSTNP